MIERLKIWDAGRKTIFTVLPPPAYYLWMLYYSNEDEDQESYMSVAEIRRQSGCQITRNTIMKWTKWLVENRWLIDTGKTAAQKLHSRGLTASRGSYNVKVYRVDDPTKGSSPNIAPQELTHSPKIDTSPNIDSYPDWAQGSSSGSDSCSFMFPVRSSISLSIMGAAAPPPPSDGEIESTTLNTKQQNKPTPLGPGGVRASNKGKSKTAPDGTPYPDGFNAWSNEQRLDWLAPHTPQSRSPKAPVDLCSLCLYEDGTHHKTCKYFVPPL